MCVCAITLPVWALSASVNFPASSASICWLTTLGCCRLALLRSQLEYIIHMMNTKIPQLRWWHSVVMIMWPDQLLQRKINRKVSHAESGHWLPVTCWQTVSEINTFLLSTLTPLRTVKGFRFVYLRTIFSANNGLFVLVPVKCVNELGEGSLSLHQLLIGTRLNHPTVLHHQNKVCLGQKTEPVSHQYPGLWQKKTKEEKRVKT